MKLYAMVDINRGQYAPKSIFEVSDEKLIKRLIDNRAAREATDDEVKLAKAKDTFISEKGADDGDAKKSSDTAASGAKKAAPKTEAKVGKDSGPADDL